MPISGFKKMQGNMLPYRYVCIASLGYVVPDNRLPQQSSSMPPPGPCLCSRQLTAFSAVLVQQHVCVFCAQLLAEGLVC